ncbi:MAG TPA: hypothetical protein VGG13_02875 [Candidatus Saccharimonadales bacterium]|jgi:hypothetical protein
MDEKQKKDHELYKEMREQHWQHWRAWGSWFSWGSPVGLGVLYALVAISSGVFIWLAHHR